MIGHQPLFGRKLRHSDSELDGDSYADGFYNFWLYGTARLATPNKHNKTSLLANTFLLAGSDSQRPVTPSIFRK